MGSPSEHASAVLALLADRPPTLGDGHLVCIDGPAGSGKTTLAEEIAARRPDAVVVHTDELLCGWHGLPQLAGTVAELVRPLASGRPGRWRRWDWYASRWAEWHTVAPGPLLVLEGVGSWSPAIAPWVTVLAWVEAPADLRRRRGLARDGDVFAPYWDQWAEDEGRLFARTRARDHADLVVATAAVGCPDA